MKEEKGNITIHLRGFIGNEKLAPGNYDISLLREVLEAVEDIVRDGSKPAENPITLSIERGSVKNVITTGKQTAMAAATVISMLGSSVLLNQFKKNTARGLDNLQKFAIKNNLDVSISTSVSGEVFTITPQTGLAMEEDLWADAEVYLYGQITDAGGKDKPNIHIAIGNKTFVIQTQKEDLKNIEGNPLYKDYSVRVRTRQNVMTGEIDKSHMELIDIVDYQPFYDEEYLDSKIRDARSVWKGIDADEFLHNIRNAQL